MAKQDHVRHLMAVPVSADLLFDLLKTSKPRVLSCIGVPVDARPFRIYNDVERNFVVVVYEHPSFPAHSLGDLLHETIWPQFTEHHGEAGLEALGHSCHVLESA